MNISKTLLTFLLFGLSILIVVPATAQDKKIQNPTKELKKVLKKLPPEVQLQVLQYAQRRERQIAQKEEMLKKKTLAKANTKPNSTKITPTRPAPVSAPTPPKPNADGTIALKPAPGAPVPPKAPANPSQPSYITKAESMAKTTVEWYEQEHNFGEIKQGETVTHTFRFKNTGDKPLQVTNVKPSCGCTAPSWTKEEIAPGKEGYIQFKFNSRGKRGMQRKSMTVFYNEATSTRKVLLFKGNVKVPVADGK